jgi:hypothetical protein
MSCIKNAFELYYQKPKNENLLKNLEETRMGLSYCQNFIPLYSTFFSLNGTNYNSINLNQTFNLQSILYSESEEQEDDRHFKNIANASVKKRNDDDDGITNVPVFFKFSPLLDPIKYLAGSYDTKNEALLHLPELNSLPIPNSASDKSSEKDDKDKENHYCHSKVLDPNNSAYVDGFFSYLSSQLLHVHDFIHGIDFYGSYLAIQKDFIVNIFDDQEYLMKNEFFKDKNGLLFYYDESECEKFLEWNQERREKNSKQTKSMNSKIKILNSVEIVAEELQQEQGVKGEQEEQKQDFNNDGREESVLVDISESDIFNIDIGDDNEATSKEEQEDGEEEGGKKERNGNGNQKLKIGSSCDADDDASLSSSSSCSSRSSHTTNESLYNMSDDGSQDGGGGQGGGDDSSDYNSEDDREEDEEGEDDEEEILNATIYNFPVEVIALERCTKTLDDLMVEDALSDEEWEAALMQIVLTLATYQKAFAFTHNDLHTNNVMFNETDKKFIYYLFNKKFYKVPTFGRIFKIIDFGRAIYRFNSKLVCSDSFHKSGDAATQYNCDPYYNDKKPLVEPNYSFDLCRLGCSLFDFFIDDIDNVDAECKKSRLVAVIVDWITDDNGRNILYKQSGVDRYPDFKLYKMIARTVHNKVPSQQLLKHTIFTQYEIPQKSVKKSMTVLDIDAIPSYVLGEQGKQ